MNPTRIYRFMPATGCIKSILNHSLRISDISQLNDPYDMVPGIDSFPEGYDKEFDVHKATVGLRKHISNQLGIISFCGKMDDPVLWAHYADNHRGMCLVFDPSVLEEGMLHKVVYSNDRPCMSFADMHAGEMLEKTSEVIYKTVETKAVSWAYEEEYRIITMITDPDSYSGFFDMPEGFLKAVVLGIDCEYTPQNIRSILNSVNLRNVRILYGQMHQSQFKVDSCEYVRVDPSEFVSDDPELEAQRLVDNILTNLSDPVNKS